MSKRILFITRYHYLRSAGGAELQCWMLAKEFARRGWETHYVCEDDRPDAPRDLDGIRLHYLPTQPFWKIGNRRECQAIFDEVQPTAIYNRVFTLYTYYAMTLAPRSAVTIWSTAAAHDGLIFKTLGEFWKTKTLRQFLALIPRTVVIRVLARRGARSANLQLAQSNELLAALRKRGFDPVLLRNSIEGTTAPAQSHTGRPVALWVGSVKKWKRPELFWELARRLSDLDCDFVMAGEVQDEVSKAPLARAEQDLPNFRYVGFIEPTRIGELFDRAHLFVSTSRAEGFPNTFIQAWQRGVPVISLDVDPDGLLRRDGLGALASTMEELEAHARRFLHDPELRKSSGARAREFTLKEFNLHANVDRLEQLIAARRAR